MTNHLGNVLQVVSDRKLQRETFDGSGVLDYYTADVVSQSDYFPFGMMLPNTDPLESETYRYLFNGKEHDPEVSGNGNVYDYGFRIYNPRIAKFLSEDPLRASYPWYTPYQFAGNMPTIAIDLDGLEEFIMIDQGNGTYKAIWDIKARDRGEANTIQYVDAAGNIMQMADQNGNMVNTRTLNGIETKNGFINQRRLVKYPLDDPAANTETTTEFTHFTSGTTGRPGANQAHTNQTVDGRPSQGEPNLPANTLSPPPPPPVVTNNPNNGGTLGNPVLAGGSSPPIQSGGGGNGGASQPLTININAQFGPRSFIPTNQSQIRRDLVPAVNALLADPTSTITLTANVASGGAGWNAMAMPGLSWGQLADSRNLAIRRGLIAAGVNPAQIIMQRGSNNIPQSMTGTVR